MADNEKIRFVFEGDASQLIAEIGRFATTVKASAEEATKAFNSLGKNSQMMQVLLTQAQAAKASAEASKVAAQASLKQAEAETKVARALELEQKAAIAQAQAAGKVAMASKEVERTKQQEARAAASASSAAKAETNLKIAQVREHTKVFTENANAQRREMNAVQAEANRASKEMLARSKVELEQEKQKTEGVRKESREQAQAAKEAFLAKQQAAWDAAAKTREAAEATRQANKVAIEEEKRATEAAREANREKNRAWREEQQAKRDAVRQQVAADREAAREAREAARAQREASSEISASMIAMGNLMADAAKKFVQWGKDVVGSFMSVGTQTRQMQIMLGGTAEDMSRLRFAGDQLGVSTDTITRSMSIAAIHLEKNDKLAQKFGVSLKDSSGNVKPTIQVIGELGDKLKSIPDPLNRAAAAKEMFGRSVREMMPLLNQGSAGLAAFAKESDALGNTMSQKDLNASKQFGLEMKQLKASITGVGMDIGRAVLPAIQSLIGLLSGAVQWVHRMWTTSEGFRTTIKAVGIVVGIAGAAILAFTTYTKVATAVTKAWESAQLALDAALEANPIGLVITAIVALIAIIIALVKNFKPVGDAVIGVSEILGQILGDAIGSVITLFRILADTALTVVDDLLMGLGWLAQGLDILTFGLTDTKSAIDGWRDSVQHARETVDTTMSRWADNAFTKGAQIGKRLGEGLVDAINNLHMPTIGGGASIPNVVDTPVGTGEDINLADTAAGGGGGAGAVNKRKKAILEFFKQLVEESYKALEALKQAAKDVRQRMLDLGKSITDTLNQAFSVTDISGATWAQYLGPQALIGGFQRRLEKMREFVSDMKKLMAMGLPKEMLLELAHAGVSGGAATAHMLVQHPEIMGQLQDLQRQITQETTAAGVAISTPMYSGELATAEKAAVDYQKVYRRRLGQAQSIGYQPTQEQINAATTNIHNEINMVNHMANMSPADIERAVAWALKTGTALGMKPYTGNTGGPGGPGGVPKDTPSGTVYPSRNSWAGEGARGGHGAAGSPTAPWLNNPRYFTGSVGGVGSEQVYDPSGHVLIGVPGTGKPQVTQI